MDEVEIVNDKDEVIGVTTRHEAHRNGIPHRIVAVFVENQKGEILVQVRMDGGHDHSSAGHVDVGEEYIDAAKRELSEELGINNVELKFIGKTRTEVITPEANQHRVHVMHIFSCVAEPGTLNSAEVKDIYWANPNVVLTEMNTCPDNMKYSDGFLKSLPIFLASRN